MVMPRMLLGLMCLGVLAAQETVMVEGRVIDGITMAGVPGTMIVLQRADRDESRRRHRSSPQSAPPWGSEHL